MDALNGKLVIAGIIAIASLTDLQQSIGCDGPVYCSESCSIDICNCGGGGGCAPQK